jgi:hypothetical protein
VAIGFFGLFRLWERDADIANWIEEASARSLYVRRYDEPFHPLLQTTPIIGKLFRRSGVMVIAHQGADLTALALMRPCPGRLVLGNTGPMTASELKRLEGQFSAAIASQKPSDR